MYNKTNHKKIIKKLLFSIPKIYGGGAERVVSVLCSSLAEIGYQVDLVLYERCDNEYPLSDKVVIHLLPKRKAKQNRLDFLFRKFFYLRNLIRKLKPDVLIPFLPFQVEHCFFCSRGYGIPFILTVRNNPEFDPPDYKMRKRRDWIASKAELIWLQNEDQKEYFSKKLWDKCFILPNPIDDKILMTNMIYRDEIKKIISVGRLETQKRQDLLIKAFAAVNKDKHMVLDIYGRGSLENELKSLITSLGQDDCIRLMGRTDDVSSTLVNYDLFILTSDYEGMPNALMEAMGIGLPCISTDCPTGPKELIGENKRGILVPQGDLFALSEAITWTTKNITEMQTKGTEAKRFICDSYSSETISNRLIQKIDEILAGRG